MCQFLIGKVQPVWYARSGRYHMCQFLIGKVQPSMRGNNLFEIVTAYVSIPYR